MKNSIKREQSKLVCFAERENFSLIGKRMMTIVLTLALAMGMSAKGKVAEVPSLKFDANKGEARVMTMHDGSKVSYTAYEGMLFVTNVEDSAYQTINVYVPDGATQQTPIFLRTYVGGYMASKAKQPSASDASGRALLEGYVVAIPGSRGRNSTIIATKADKKAGIKKGQTVYTGRAPAAILDLKAAIRYLREFDKEMPGDAEKIITDGTSAGGAMSSLMGATGNNPAYEPLLQAMGAAKQRDDVFASVCFCPITDLDHADMAYEWLYNGTDSRQQGNADVLAVSNELKAQFPAYINSLHLKTPDGTLLTADNYLDYIKSEIIRSAQIAKNAGADIPDSIGFVFNKEDMGGMPPINGGMTGGMKKSQGQMPPMMRGGRGGFGNKAGDYITDLDMTKYLNYLVSTQPLKTAPAFDTKGVAGQNASGENEEFGDVNGSSENFTEYGCTKTGTSLTDDIRENVRLLNPMYFIDDEETDVAPHWYIRHGARDRDTSFPIPVNLALKLQNAGKDVNFLLAWNRPHSGDYALDELFQWIRDITATPSFSVTEALKQRRSTRSYSSEPLTNAQILDILWAANGTNDHGTRTAPSAVNAQDIELYVIKADGAYKYLPTDAKLEKVTDEDIRPYIQAQNRFIMDAPVTILLVTDQSKFRAPREGQSSRNMNFGMMDAGIVSENISLYVTSVGLATVPCAPRIDVDAVQKALGLTDQQIPLIYHPIGNPKK